MEQLLLLMILAGTTHALSVAPETTCDARVLFFSCNPVPGATLYLRLMTNATGYVLVFAKILPSEHLKVFIVKNGTVKIRESYRDRVEFSIDTGTLKITDIQAADAGQYSFDVYTPIGIMVISFSFTLNVEEKKFNFPSIYISVFPVVGVLILIVVGCVVWKKKPCRNTGYQRLH